MKSDRLDLRITKAEKASIIRGAKKARQSMASFVITAALQRVDSILGTIGNSK